MPGNGDIPTPACETMVIIPARGGSKSIPQKNIAPLGGKPLIAHILQTARHAPSISRVVVSTDDEEIAAVSRQYGAEVPFLRPVELAKDESPTLPVIEHAAAWLAEHEGYRPEIMVLLQATSPFTSVAEIEEAVRLLVSRPDVDAATTVIEAPHNFHPYNIRRINEDGTVTFMMEKEHYLYPTRQSKPRTYAFANVYAFRYRTLVEQRSLFGKRCLPIVIDPLRAFDINDPHDLIVAEAIMKNGALDR
jgi:CMP-N-acetylneuraminic acid synthetase